VTEPDNKEKLLEIMERLLVILRDVLSSIRLERRAHEEDNPIALRGIEDERLKLFAAYEHWSNATIMTLQTIAGEGHQEQLETLENCLENLPKFIEADDVELHLLRDQMNGMVAEIHEQSQSLLDFLEHKAVPSSNFHDYFREIRPVKPRISVGLLEQDESDDSEIIF
jgi:hypothetical protein